MSALHAEKLVPTRLEDVALDKPVSLDDEDAGFHIDPVAERKLLRKIDLRLIPILSFLFLLAFLDRSNIGNAKIEGMIADLRMTKNDYSISLFVFFIPYILLEVPSNILIKRMRPSNWLSGIMVGWGVASVCQGLVHNNAQLAGCRFLVGMFEAGFYPGCIYLISSYYKRFELQRRFTLFFCTSILSGSFSGLLAYAIAKMDGVGGYAGWRWIFILEGLFTVVVAVASRWLIADWPEQATFLNEEERRMIRVRLRSELGNTRMDRLDSRAKRRVFGDWKIYVGIIMYLGIVNTSYSTAFFIPTIIQELGFTANAAQVRSIPVFIVATVISLTFSWLTDLTKHRYTFCIIGILLSTLGEILLLVGDAVSVGVRYFAIFAVTSGTYITQPITVAWVSNNLAGHYKQHRIRNDGRVWEHWRDSGQQCLHLYPGAKVGFLRYARQLWHDKLTRIRYPVGYGVSVGLQWMCALACTVLLVGLKRENKKRDRGERDYRLSEPDADNMGDDYPTFRFVF